MRLALGCVLLTMSVCAQEKPADPPAASRALPPEPKNLKILKVQNGGEVSQVMRTFTAGLGVQCSYCHVQGNFASDENPKKAVALRMIEMTQKLNVGFGDKKMHVTCYTCHRGEAEPKTAPSGG